MFRTSPLCHPGSLMTYCRGLLGLLCVMGVGGTVTAQTPTTSAGKSKDAPPPGLVETVRPAPPAEKAAPTPSEAAKPHPAVPRSGSRNMTPDPNAKFVCTETTATHPAVWRDQGDPSFTFKISNPGTADLNIRAKGG